MQLIDLKQKQNLQKIKSDGSQNIDLVVKGMQQENFCSLWTFLNCFILVPVTLVIFFSKPNAVMYKSK